AAAEMPKLPAHYRGLFTGLQLEQGVIANLVESPQHSKLLAELLDKHGSGIAKRVALWLVNVLSGQEVSKTVLVELSQLVSDEMVSSTAAKEVLLHIAKEGGEAKQTAEALGLLQESNTDTIEPIVKQVLADNPQAV